MCQLCSDSNEKMEPTDNKLIGPNDEQRVGSSMLNAVSPEPPGTVKQENSSSYVPPLTSPTVSLTSSDSFASNCSESSVDVNSHDGLNPEAGGSGNGQVDLRYTLPNGHRSKSSSSANPMKDSDNMKENNERKNGHVIGNLDYRESFKSLDLSDDESFSSSDELVDEEDEPSPAFDDNDEIWDPPEAENDLDNEENSMAALADDDDECADGNGTEWAEPSSLTYRFREEKQKAMEEVMNGKFKALVSELLKKFSVDNCEKLDESWVDIVTPLAWQAALFVKPSTTEDKAMDPAGYLKIKCIASGSRDESQLIKGLVFKKHAAHKHMVTKYKNPRLLLIRGMLGQSSGSSGLSSFNSMITQSQDKDNNNELTEKLKASHANVILVEKSASRDVLEEVLKLGVTLVLDMKLHRLERVARCTGSPILSSDISFCEKLKHCDSLYFEKFVEEHAIVGEGGKKPCKTLMFLDGCHTRLGCTILLKGSQSDELKKIKCVVQCAVVMAYHFILETSFLVDQKAMFSTIAFGQTCDNSITNEQSISVVSETSNMSHIEEPNVGSADGVQISISNGSDGQSFHVQDFASKTASSVILEVPIPNGCHVKESIHVKETSAKAAETATSNGFHENFSRTTELVDGPSNICYKPHMGTLSDASSSIDDALHKVSIVSPDTYQNMSTYIDLNEEKPEAQTEALSPVSPTEEASDQGDTKPKDSSKEDNIFQNHSQPLSTFATALEDDRKVIDDGEECIRPKDEISSVLDSESILVLMSSRNSTRGTICEQSHFSHIKFYRNFDVPLGRFLQDNLFNQNLQCKACNGLPEAHFYYYAHHNKQLTIRVKRLGDKKDLPGESEGKLWMWSRCSKCKPDEEKATKRVLISTAARGLSFGKFLELSFSSHSLLNCLSSCGHSFQKDFLYFFGLGSMVAMFRYSRVATYTVSVPAEKLEFNCSINKDWLQQEIESVYTKGLLLFTEVANYLKKIESRFGGLKLVLNGSLKAFADILGMLKLERSEFEENIKNIGIKIDSSNNSAHKLLSLNRLRWEIMLAACVWDRRLQLLLSSSLASSTSADRAVPRQTDLEDSSARGETEGLQTAAAPGVQGQMSYGPGEEDEETAKNADSVLKQMETDLGEGMMSEAADIGHYDAVIEGKEVSESGTDVEIQIEAVIGTEELSLKEPPCGEMLHGEGEQDCMSLSVAEQKVEKLTSGDSCPSVSLLQESGSANLLSNGDSHHTDNNSLSGNSLVERNIPIMADGEDSSSAHKDGETSISTASKEGEDNISFSGKLASKGLTSPSFSKLGDSEEWIWNPFGKIGEECMKDLHERSLPKFGHLPKFELLHSSDFLPTVSQVINEEGSRLHIPISNSDYIVSDFDGEISSSVACALALMKDMILPGDGDNATLKRASSEPSAWSLSSSYDPDIFHSTPSMPPTESRFSSFDSAVLLDSLFSSEQFHPEVNLGTEKYPAKGKCSVVIMYAGEFRRLRNHCCPSELDYIASLSRCTNWDAKGGKSKSVFSKTLDDRLIIKEIKQRELESFMKFAPTYFRHMKESFASRNQICLAKILGIYQVTIRHAKSGKETKHDLMVQENLSYGRNITRQYDLKGALHARFNATADAAGDVLLDQNFVNDMNSSPIYIGQKSKRLLQRAVWNDTSFLNSVNVMDYSLLVGVDRKQRVLVCGIIDYLRQYTWDKQLETWVKSSLVVPKNVLPTIISPKEYKKRFRKFMDTHFMTVPDHWCSQRSSNPCRLCGIKGDDSSVQKAEKREEELNGISSS